jgi:hypothetical protein
MVAFCGGDVNWTTSAIGIWQLEFGPASAGQPRQETSPGQLPIAECQLPFARLKWGK